MASTRFSEVEYLGHLLSAESVRISEKRVEAIGKISVQLKFQWFTFAHINFSHVTSKYRFIAM